MPSTTAHPPVARYARTAPRSAAPVPTADGAAGDCADREFGALGERFRRIRKGEFLTLWQWVLDLKMSCDQWLAEAEGGSPAGQGASRRLTLREIAARLGERPNRKSYRRWWVSRALKTARLFPQPPAGDAEQRAFKNCLNGHVDQADKTPEQLRGQALRTAARALKRALALGSALDRVCQAVRAVIGHSLEIRKRSESAAGPARAVGGRGAGPWEGRP